MARASKSKITRKSATARPERAAQKPIDLYYWSTPNGFKISIMLEECRLPYRVIPINISKGDQFKPEFLAISPNNRIPAIVDPQGPGGKPISIFESGAILQYLGRKTGNSIPPPSARGSRWNSGCSGRWAGSARWRGRRITFASMHRKNCLTRSIAIPTNVNRLYGVMNKRLADREFLAGKYSIADIACVGWVIRWERHGQDIERIPPSEALA